MRGTWLSSFARQPGLGYRLTHTRTWKRTRCCWKSITSEGWLTDLNGIKSSVESRCAAYADYAGDRSRAAWHFDREMAEATIAYHKDEFPQTGPVYQVGRPALDRCGSSILFHETHLGPSRQYAASPPGFCRCLPLPIQRSRTPLARSGKAGRPCRYADSRQASRRTVHRNGSEQLHDPLRRPVLSQLDESV